MTPLLLAVLLAADAKADPNAAAKAAAQLQQDMMRAQAQAEQACKPLENEPIPLEKEVEIGKQMLANTQKQVGQPVTGPLAEYVQGVGTRVAAGAQRHELQWTFVVLENTAPKSGPLPGGTVLVTTGLLARLKNEAQLAAVLAVEVAHLDLDIPSKLSRANATICRSTRSMQAVKKEDVPEAFRGLDTAMSKTMEVQSFSLSLLAGPTGDEVFDADAAAVSLLVRANYPPAEWKKVLETVPLEPLNGEKPSDGKARSARLLKLPPAKSKAPPFPKKLKWPKA